MCTFVYLTTDYSFSFTNGVFLFCFIFSILIHSDIHQMTLCPAEMNVSGFDFVEWSAVSPSKGVRSSLSANTHLTKTQQKGTRPTVSPCPKHFVLEEAAVVAPSSLSHVTRLEMREAVVHAGMSPLHSTSQTCNGE